MNRYTLILTLLLSLMFSSPSYSEWTKVVQGIENGTNYYVDFERIRKFDGYVYYWVLSDFLKPNEWGTLSFQVYKQGDCKLFRNKFLSLYIHKEPMGKGSGDIQEPVKSLRSWWYPPPKSSMEIILKTVCNHIGE